MEDKEGVEFKVRLSTATFGFGIHELTSKCLIVKVGKDEHYFQEGHSVYNALFRFAQEYPKVFSAMKRVRIEAMKGEELYMIERMFQELHYQSPLGQ